MLVLRDEQEHNKNSYALFEAGCDAHIGHRNLERKDFRMVVLAAKLSAEEKAALEAALKFKLKNLKEYRSGRHQRHPSVLHRRRRNDQSCHDVADGFQQCPSASCDLLIPSEAFLSDQVVCDAGHVTDMREMELQELLNPGGIALVGVTNTQQGRIAEQVVWDLHDLGDHGVLTEWLSDIEHNSTFDMVTSTGLPVEVRSVSTRAANQAFALSPGKKRRMDAEMQRRRAPGQVGILVILDFVTMTADVYVRFMRRAIYFERPAEAFTSDIPFTNPYAEPELAAVGADSDDMPF